MIEIENKYKIYEKKFGYVNWIGLWTLYKKEVLRFLIVVIQTVISPLVTSLLFPGWSIPTLSLMKFLLLPNPAIISLKPL